MIQILSIAFVAGAASAVLVSSLLSGTFLAIVLFSLARLPIIIAAIGWHHLAALLAAMIATAILAISFTGTFALAFLVTLGLPAWWLGYLALLGRPDANGTMEWYPPGRLVYWSALLGGFVVIVFALSKFGFDADAFYGSLKADLETMLRQGRPPGADGAPRPDLAVSDAALESIARWMPTAAGLFASLVNVFNVWLAGRIVLISGRLRRPWPDLSAMQLPMVAHATFALSIVATMLPGFIGLLGSVLCASLLMAYALIGFAVLHAVTRGMRSRRVILAAVYLTSLVLAWPLAALIVIGLADAAFDFRRRFTGGTLPPPSVPTT